MQPTFIILALVCAFILGIMIGYRIKENEVLTVGSFIINTDKGAEHLFEIHFDEDLSSQTRKKIIAFNIEKR